MPFKPFKVSITITDPEDCQTFLEGLILAAQNNNSEYFQDLIDSINASPFAEYRRELIEMRGDG